ncbi:hypothetical protein SDC9_197227 [bioreactor metagenome]|uniref:Uncharacterized protein n=1 Tax=bioreactor metagenome TaxID=1076179 RepID=A0A645IE79_9ZZZZ
MARSTPVDLPEQRQQLLSPGRIHLPQPGEAALQVGAEIRVLIAVLLPWAVAAAVGEDGFQPVVLGARQVGMAVDEQTGQHLRLAGRAQAGLAPVGGKALLNDDFLDQKLDAAGAGGVRPGQGKSQVIDVAAVSGVAFAGQAGQSQVQPIGAEIGQCRRG